MASIAQQIPKNATDYRYRAGPAIIIMTTIQHHLIKEKFLLYGDIHGAPVAIKCITLAALSRLVFIVSEALYSRQGVDGQVCR